MLKAASKEYEWNLPLDVVAEIWREGCIIRSVFLNDIADAFRAEPDLESLLLSDKFSGRMAEAANDLREVVGISVKHALPMPALPAALSYFDYFRREQSTANVLQGQSDFFGAHGFERVGEEGNDHHGPWAMG